VATGAIYAYGVGASFGLSWVPDSRYFGWMPGHYDAFNTTTGARVWVGTPGTLMALSDAGALNVTGTITGAILGSVANTNVGTDLHVGGNSYLTGTLTASAATTTGNVAIGLDLAVTRNAYVTGALYGSNANLSGTLGVGGELTAPLITATGDLHVNNNAYVTGTITAPTITASGTVSAAIVSSTGNVTANGTVAGAALASSGNLAVAGVADITGKLTLHQGLKLSGIAPYANNAAALAGGLGVADVYFNTTANALSVVL
jgi:cytoskeletal protein CcmA (bactofilin family)